MDHIGILKRAWQITWRYKALWILGLFAGASYGSGNFRSYGSGGSSGNNAPFNNNPFQGRPSFGQFTQLFERYLPVIIAGIAVLFVIGVILFVLSIAARGGLVWLANEAAEGREVRAGRGWGAGFHYWGRTFLIGFLLGLPIVLVALVLGVLFAGTIVTLIASSRGSDGGAAAGAGVAGVCGLIGVGVLILLPLAILIGILDQLALRHGVLEDMPATRAIGLAWWDVRHRFKDVALLWLLLIVVGFVYGIVLGIVAVIVALPAAGLAFAGAWPLAIGLGLVLFLALLLPGAIYATFQSTSWTIFFRRLTGREVVAPPAPAFGGGYAPPPPGGYAPPPPPAGYPPPPAPTQPPGGYPPPAPPSPQAPPPPQGETPAPPAPEGPPPPVQG